MKISHFLVCVVMAGGAARCAFASGVPHAANTYDINNRLTQVTYSDGRQVSYAYDAMGNITSVKTKAGVPPVVLVGDPILGSVRHPIADYRIQSNRPGDVTGYVVSGLPKGLKANTNTAVNADGKAPGVIYGKPTAGGTFKITVSLKSASGTGAPSVILASIDTPFSTLEDGFSLTGGFSGSIDSSALTGGELGGWLSVKTTTTGAFSGSLQLGASKHAFKGAFDGSSGSAPTMTIVRKLPLGNLSLDLSMTLGGPSRGQIIGALSDGGAPEVLTLNREVWNTKNLATLFGGAVSTRYNVALNVETANQGDDNFPQGFGYASITVRKVGAANLTGKLQDGTAITMSKILWPDGTLPIFIPLYAKNGVLNGSLMIDPGTDYSTADNPVEGQVFWKRPVSRKATDRLYALGFETNIDIYGGAYTPPAKGFRVLDLGGGAIHPGVQLALDDGGLTPPGLLTGLTLSTASKVTAFTPNSYLYKLTFTPATGLFSGSFTLTAPARRTTIIGLIVPNLGLGKSFGFGYFLLPGPATTDPIMSGNAWIGQP